MDKKNLIIYFDYEIEKKFKDVSHVRTYNDTLVFYFHNDQGVDSKAQYDMNNLLGFVYEI